MSESGSQPLERGFRSETLSTHQVRAHLAADTGGGSLRDMVNRSMLSALADRVEELDAIRVAAWRVVHANQPMILGTVEDDLYRALCEFDFSLSPAPEQEKP